MVISFWFFPTQSSVRVPINKPLPMHYVLYRIEVRTNVKTPPPPFKSRYNREQGQSKKNDIINTKLLSNYWIPSLLLLRLSGSTIKPLQRPTPHSNGLTNLTHTLGAALQLTSELSLLCRGRVKTTWSTGPRRFFFFPLDDSPTSK